MPVLPRGAWTTIGRASGPAVSGVLPSLARLGTARSAVRVPVSPGTPLAFQGTRADTYTGDPEVDGSGGWTRGPWLETHHAVANGSNPVILDPRAMNTYYVTTSVEVAGGPPFTTVVLTGQRVGSPPVQVGGGVRSIPLDGSGYGIDSVEWWGTLGPGQGLSAGIGGAYATGMTVSLAVGGYKVLAS